MSITARIYVIVSLIAITSLLVAGVGIFKMAEVGNELEEIAHEDIPLTEKVTAITLHQLEQAIVLERILRSAGITQGAHPKDDIAKFKKLAAHVDEEIKEGEVLVEHALEHAISDASYQEYDHVSKVLKQVEDEHHSYEEHAFEILKLIEAGDITSAGALVEQIEQEQEKLDTELEELLLELEKFTEESAEHALAGEMAGIYLMLIIGLGGSAIGVGVGAYFGRNISRGVKNITTSMVKLADGDLDSGISGTNRRDEIGKMSAAVSVFKENAIKVRDLENDRLILDKQIEQDRNMALQTMADAIETQMEASVQTVMDQAQKMILLSSVMKSSSDSVSVNATEVGASASQSMAMVQTVSAAAEELSVSIEQMENSRSVSTQAVEANAHTKITINGLADTVVEIDEVVTLIKDIAGQTNLLALNATIEAARAGEAGKGFAVVANEVKSLANQTAIATETISSHIENVKSVTDVAVNAVESVDKAILEVDEIGGEVADAVEQQKLATVEISSSVNKSAVAAKDVSIRTEDVSQEANKTKQHSIDVETTLSALSRDIADLKGALKKILDSAGKSTSGRDNDRYDVKINSKMDDTVACTVINISNSGMLLELGPELEQGNEGTIDIPGISFPIKYTIRGFNDNSIRASFELTDEQVKIIDDCIVGIVSSQSNLDTDDDLEEDVLF